MKGVTLPTETVSVMEMSPIKSGLGATDEIAHDVRRFGLGKVQALPGALIALMRDVGIPNGLTAIGYGGRDVPALIDGCLKQPRLLARALRSAGAQELDGILRDSMQCW